MKYHLVLILCAACVCAACGEDNAQQNTSDTSTTSADTQENTSTDATDDATHSADDSADTNTADGTADDTSGDTADTLPIPDIDYTNPIDLSTYTGPTVAVSGNAMKFSQGGGRLEGATITVLEFPGISATTDADGAFSFPALPSGAQVSLLLTHPDYPVVQTGTLTLADQDLERVTFQAPDLAMYDLLAGLTRTHPNPDRCQIATTVTRVGLSMYDSGTSHGEPDATVTMSPDPVEVKGPIYFNLVSHDTIYPDADLTATTLDGGVLFLNVFPGEYTLRAQKPDTTFVDVIMRCRPGVLVNASPPWGIQATEGGIGPVFTP